MKEMREILQAYETVKGSGSIACFATLVSARGSTYRRPGAHMLFMEGEKTIGTLSGGCLDNDLAERARRVVGTGLPLLVTYDSTAPEDIVFGLGLGCGGVVQVLLERVPTGGRRLDPFAFIAGCVSESTHGVMALVYEAAGGLKKEVGARMMVRGESVHMTDVGHRSLAGRISVDAQHALSRMQPTNISYQEQEGDAEVFFEVVRPPVSLIVLGAGVDAVPLVGYACGLGWAVTVVDARAALLVPGRLHPAASLVLSPFDEIERHVRLRREDAVVIMTHNFNHDIQLLKAALSSPAQYVGLLASRSKVSSLFQRLREEGFTPTNDQLAKFYSPIGLDIGAETPEEIALAALAEIQAVLTGRTATSLRDRRG